MNKGPSATLGIMFKLTSSGITAASTGFDQVKTIASAIPTITASA